MSGKSAGRGRGKDSGQRMDLEQLTKMLMTRMSPSFANYVSEETLELKRDVQDLKLMNRALRADISELRLEFKSLGIALGQLGTVEIKLLNEMKDRVRNRIGVTNSQGQIQGRVDSHFFCITPVSSINPPDRSVAQ